jgi:hypothetical protein
VRIWTGFIWLKRELSEPGNELSGSIKGVEFLNYFNNYYLLNEDYALWS